MKNFLISVVITSSLVALGWAAITIPVGFYADGKCIGVENRSGHLVRCEGAPQHEAVHIAPGTTFESLQRERFEIARARGEVVELTHE